MKNVSYEASSPQSLLTEIQTPRSWLHRSSLNFKRCHLSMHNWFPSPPIPDSRAHAQVTTRPKPSAPKDRCVFCAFRHLQCMSLKKNVWKQMVQFRWCRIGLPVPAKTIVKETRSSNIGDKRKHKQCWGSQIKGKNLDHWQSNYFSTFNPLTHY